MALIDFVHIPSFLIRIDWKAIGRAKAGKRYKPVEKFRKFEKTENTFTLNIRESRQKICRNVCDIDT